jgi:putative ABC transport system ATP-binding protein
MDLLTELNRDQGLTVVIVTHDEHLARWSSRAVRFLDGRIVKEGEEAA